MKKKTKRFNLLGLLKSLFNLLYLLVLILLGLVAVSAILTSFGAPGGLKLFSVQSGSMAPAIPAGSLVVVKPAGDYQKGEVITFKQEGDRLVENPKSTTTHRIHEIKEVNNKTFYITKGDFNPTPDLNPVEKDLVLGKMVFRIPLLGFPVSYAKTKDGFVFLIVVPATIIVYNEILNIKKEVWSILAKRREKKSAKKA